MTALHALLIHRDTLNKDSIYHSVITNLLQQLQRIRTASIEQAAELCFTSPATLSRLARTLGYQGYSDFRTQLDYGCRNYAQENRVMPRVPDATFHPGVEYLELLQRQLQRYHEIVDLELFAHAAKVMQNSTRILLFLGDIQNPAAIQLQVDLSMGGKACLRFTSQTDPALLSDLLDPNCFVVLLYSAVLPGMTFTELMRKIRFSQASLLLLAPQNAPVPRSQVRFLLEYPATGTAMDNYLQQISLSMLTMAYRTAFLDPRLAELGMPPAAL